MKKSLIAKLASKCYRFEKSNFFWMCVILGVLFLSFLAFFISKEAFGCKIPQYFISTPMVLFLVLFCVSIAGSILKEQSPEYKIKQLQDFIAQAPMEHKMRQKANEVIEEAVKYNEPQRVQEFFKQYRIIRDLEQQMFKNSEKYDPKIKEHLDSIKEQLGVI